ncbi:MAG: hypothetical protein GY696_37325, partial [Gammaproteobacteria bacterium]|nr:hypothetical protein [Gammaproteobacteria bacterium]
MAVEIKLKRQTFLVASIYKPPATCTVDFVSNLSDFLSECANPRHEILLLGDTNVDALQPVFLDRFAGFLDTYRLQQIVSDPTHKGHIIDQVFASSRRLFSLIGTGPPIEKHHSLVWVQLCLPELQVDRTTFEHWKWDSADWDHLKFDLLDASDGGQRNWGTEVWEAPSIHHAAAQFQDQISLAQAQYVPHKKITLRRSQCPWFSKPLLRKIERKNKAFKAMNRN